MTTDDAILAGIARRILSSPAEYVDVTNHSITVDGTFALEGAEAELAGRLMAEVDAARPHVRYGPTGRAVYRVGPLEDVATTGAMLTVDGYRLGRVVTTGGPYAYVELGRASVERLRRSGIGTELIIDQPATDTPEET